MFYDFIANYIIPYLFSESVLSMTIPVPLADGATVSLSTLLSVGVCILIFIFIAVPLLELLSWLICLPVRLFAVFKRGSNRG